MTERDVSPEPATLPCPIARMAAEHPSAPAVIARDGSLSYEEYHASVCATAERLAAVGVERESVVGIVSPACVEYVVMLMALFRLGAVACPLSPRWPAKVVHDAMLRTRCNWLVSGSPLLGKEIPQLRVLDLAESVCITRNPHRRAFLRSRPAPETRNPVIDTGARATIVFTSGSAGEPKAAVHSYGNHYFSAAASNRNLPVKGGDGWLLSLSLHHVAGIGILFRCVLGGGAVVIPYQEKPSRGEGSRCCLDYEHEHEIRNPATLLLQDIGREEVTHVSLVPTQLYRLLRTAHGRENLKRLKAILLGGGSIPESLIREAAALELPIFTTYGLTETASQVATTRPGDALDRLLTAGTPLISGTVSVASDGEILVRGPTLFLGYLEGGRVERPLTSDGWFRTGDLGILDSAGYLSVVGRKDNRFVCGGENVQPEEVERCLCRLTGLRAAVVVPVPDDEFGHIPVAFVAMKEGGKVNEQELAGSLTEELARSKIPRRFLAWPRGLEPGDAKLNRNGLMVLARTLTAESRGLQGR